MGDWAYYLGGAALGVLLGIIVLAIIIGRGTFDR